MSNEKNSLGGEIVVYQTEDGINRIVVKIEGETVWLPQAALAELFETSKQNISLHIKNIFKEGELIEKSVVKEYLTTASDKKQYMVTYYNLDMIIAIGYRVRSPRGTQFRQWATERLSEYLVKGFTLDDERLKGGRGLADYFDELLARIREIRASEARVYQMVRNIFALASDYKEGEKETKLFFASMQNKMHYAATEMTAAEIIKKRADSDKANMGLTTWKGGRVLKRDVSTAKNYLDEKEIDTLNRITVMFLDQAEFRAQRRKNIKMRDWDTFLDKFLTDTELPVLTDAGSVSHDLAIEWAEEQYADFADRRRLQAEEKAEARYIEDLRTSAGVLETKRRKSAKKKTTKKPAKKKAGKKASK